MKRLINPLIDCVFKAILGDPDHKEVLQHFLNSILKPVIPITYVEIQNPYNAKEFVADKLTIVDVKARDEHGRLYQIEVQLTLDRCLGERMMYNWSVLYKKQIEEGDDYSALHPVIAIWLLDGTMFPESPVVHHHFQVYDSNHEVSLTDQCSIHVLELPKWKKPENHQLNPEDSWLYFFEEAKHWQELPEELKPIESLREAMNVLKRFSEKDADYWLYEARLEGMRLQRFREKEMLRIEQEKSKIEQEKFQVEQEKSKIEQEKFQVEQEKAKIEQDLKQALLLVEKTQRLAEQDKQKTEQELLLTRQREEKLVEQLKQAGLDPDKE
ncbi:MAG: Rpn family recombination-promoting nuclease/putative transposase [SAR324 cluster bacterium]|nr:Rpn family recombination-promoting nuclease/putative transposase [SAR324 cluster bacterium]